MGIFIDLWIISRQTSKSFIFIGSKLKLVIISANHAVLWERQNCNKVLFLGVGLSL